jgi:hypothetical protein
MTALLWIITQRVAVIPYRCFGTTYRSRIDEKELCYIPNKMDVVRYAGDEGAAGSWGMLVQARTGHLRIYIHESNRNSLCVENADLL